MAIRNSLKATLLAELEETRSRVEETGARDKTDVRQ